MKKTGFLILNVLVSLSFLVAFRAQAGSVKHFAPAVKGCIPSVSRVQADEIIQRFNLKAVGATDEEVRALGTGLTWIEKLNGGMPLPFAVWPGRQPYGVKFLDRVGNSSQGAMQISISRNGGRQYGRNVAQLVHELGHLVGNAGAYRQYREAVGGRYCVVSGYSDDRANEQFAEVFAAFVTYPSLIKDNKSSACQAAYKFFSEKLFAKGDLADKCYSKTLKAGVDY